MNLQLPFAYHRLSVVVVAIRGIVESVVSMAAAVVPLPPGFAGPCSG